VPIHAILALLLTVVGTAVQNPAVSTQVHVRYVANAGVLLTIDGRKVLVDAPIRDGIPPYQTSSSEERVRLEEAKAPYDGVTAILITHWHDDHCSPEAIASHLRRSGRTVLISSREVVERVRAVAADLPADRFRPTTPAPGSAEVVPIDGLRIHVLRIPHNPSRRLPEEHVGFLVQGTRTALHVGDADPEAAHFSLLAGLPAVDVALVPFWFLTDAKTARTTVAGVMKPAHTVGLHLPSAEAEAAVRTLRERGLKATLLRVPGEIQSLIPNR
jgi:L-ascorbate metabolism protein UlaG (beta-lactamase superfamily)